MCGITARTSSGDALASLLRGLETLECRGYDSAGVALRNGSGIDVHRCAGRPTDLAAVLDSGALGGIAIGHTRWCPDGSTTGTDVRPPTDCTGEVAVVHDGDVENREELRTELSARGHEFASEAAVLPHLVEERLEAGDTPPAAFRAAVRRLEGSFAAVMLVANRDAIYAARSGSPLFLGVADDGYVLASAVPAFLSQTDTVVSLEDGDVAVVTPTTHAVTDLDGDLAIRPPETVGWTPAEAP